MRDGMAPGEEGDSWVVTLDVSTPSTPSHCRANPTIIIPSNKSSRISQLYQNHQLGIEDSGLEKMAIYCPQGSVTLRQQLLIMHGIAWFCMVLHGIAWYCMVLHGIALYS